ncbi:hypothetical protein [Idiomarina sp.]|uniref:hypothetical protein n=1 Tax=Idiomarina sp. TaxID=1874361 RepID=UPI002EA64627|nr:hypothetical protein [Pseudomonadota bacterium]
MKLLIENSEARRVITANFNLADSIAQLAEYIESDSVNKFGLVEIIKHLRNDAFVIASGVKNSISEVEEKRDSVELALIAGAFNKLTAEKFGYCCSEKDSPSCFKRSSVLKCVKHP